MVGPSLVAGAVDHLSEQRGSAAGRHVDEGEAAVARVAHLGRQSVERGVRHDHELLGRKELDDEEEGRHLGMRMGGSNTK